MGKLTDTALRKIKATGKVQKHTDGRGLYIYVSAKGYMSWRIDYSFERRRNTFTLGQYPHISLATARKQLLELKEQLANGIDPSAERKAQKQAQVIAGLTFQDVLLNWYETASLEWGEAHRKDQYQKISTYIFPTIGQKPLPTLNRADIKQVLDALVTKKPTLKKVRSILSQVLRYIMIHEEKYQAQNAQDWTILYQDYTKGHTVKNRACLTKEDDIARLMKGIEAYRSISLLTGISLEFSALTFCRPTEIRHAEWQEIDWSGKTWTIPKEKMKMKRPHIVPLASRTMELLKELKTLTGSSRYLFPSARGKSQPMSEACILVAIRSMGFSKEEMSAHGFRGMASTVLNGKGFNGDWVEMQLAHVEKNKVRNAYNHSSWLEERREMMEWYADFLMELKG